MAGWGDDWGGTPWGGATGGYLSHTVDGVIYAKNILRNHTVDGYIIPAGATRYVKHNTFDAVIKALNIQKRHGVDGHIYERPYGGGRVIVGYDASGNTIVAPQDGNYLTMLQKFPGPNVSSGAGGYGFLNLPAPLYAAGTTGAIDLGGILSGQFTLNITTTKIGGGTAWVDTFILVSNDGIAWNELPASSGGVPFPVTTSARYVKARFNFNSANIDTTHIVTSAKVHVAATPKEESGVSDVPSSGILDVTFANDYAYINKVPTPVVEWDGALKFATWDIWPDLSGGTLHVFMASTFIEIGGRVMWTIGGY